MQSQDRGTGTWKTDLLQAPLCEAALILIVGAAGWIAHQPMIFASLGPTAFEMVETPERRSAEPYSVLVGHLTGILAAFLSLWLTRAWWAPAVSASGVPGLRVWATALAAMLTVFGNLLTRASQPAAVSTTLLIASGLLQTKTDGVLIMASIALITLTGEPLRRWRRNQRHEAEVHLASR